YLGARGEDWDRFRHELMGAIAELGPDTPYYEAWVTALERLLAADGLVPASAITIVLAAESGALTPDPAARTDSSRSGTLDDRCYCGRSRPSSSDGRATHS